MGTCNRNGSGGGNIECEVLFYAYIFSLVYGASHDDGDLPHVPVLVRENST